MKRVKTETQKKEETETLPVSLYLANEQSFPHKHTCFTRDNSNSKTVFMGTSSPHNTKNAFNFLQKVNKWMNALKKEAFLRCDVFFFHKNPHLCRIKRGTSRALREVFQGTAKTQINLTTCFLLLGKRKFKQRVWSHLKLLLNSARPEDRNQRPSRGFVWPFLPRIQTNRSLCSEQNKPLMKDDRLQQRSSKECHLVAN